MRYLYLFLITLCLSFSLSAETRSVWVLPWDMQSPQAIDQVIEDALRYHQNELLLEVRYRSDALYQPNRVPNSYPNPEPRSYILDDDGFDPLAYAIEKASPHGIRIQAWVVVFNATPLKSDLLEINHIYQNHRDWITHDDEDRPMRSPVQFGYFIDPGIPAVQDYLLDVFSDIVSGYRGLYGLHLDYLRYPNVHLGYHPVSVQRYQEEGDELTWNQWRTKQVTDFTTKCNQRIKQINPDIILSAAVFADINAARNSYAQDWYDWLERGIIDLAYPMVYHLDYDEYCRQIKCMESHDFTDRIVVGLRAWENRGAPLLPWTNPDYNVAHIYDRIAHARRSRFKGIALFSYNGIIAGDAFTHLASLAYSPIAAAYDFSSPASVEDTASPALTDDQPQPPASFPKPTAAEPQTAVNEAGTAQTSSLDLDFTMEDGLYAMRFSLPREGRWHLQVLDENRQQIYERHRFYFTQSNLDYWDGIQNDGSQLKSGKYLLLFSLGDMKLHADIKIGG